MTERELKWAIENTILNLGLENLQCKQMDKLWVLWLKNMELT